MACEYLIRMHERRGDKIIVFADDVFALQTLALKLDKCFHVCTSCLLTCVREFIFGDTPTVKRHEILSRYKKNKSFKTIFFSKIADNAFDLPEANVLIQV